jgi:cytidine deaminase
MSVPAAVWKKMRTAAKAASRRAYCGYSEFPVGAALLTADGSIVAGCNVENASYGLSMCAERSAVFRMVAGGELEIVAVVVYTPTKVPTAPCGACRQVLFEFGADAEVISICDTETELRSTVRDLLPGAFGPANLG